MPQQVLVVIAAVLVGLISFALFLSGEWWGRKRRAEFFLDRPSLVAEHGSGPLEAVETAHCVWLSGQKVFKSGEDLEKIRKLILPNPDANSVTLFEGSLLPPQIPIKDDIRNATKAAQQKDIPVRWYKEFTGHSWWIGDPDKPSAFVHIECLLPNSQRERRPSFRVYRWQDEDFYQRHCKIFNQMWDASEPPPA